MSKDSSNIPSLEDAIQLALTAHWGAVDKGGQPYILHPIRLMVRMDTHEERLAAILHDVVEDSPTTLDDLRRRGYPESVVAAVDALTRRDSESYEDFIQRLKPNPLARKVKLADLEDNMDLTRLPQPTPRDYERRRKYDRAKAMLTDEDLTG